MTAVYNMGSLQSVQCGAAPTTHQDNGGVTGDDHALAH